MEGRRIPEVTFKCREGDNQQLADGGCGFIGGEWKDVTTRDIFKDKRVVVFSLPGAFTPTCSSQQVPGYEKHYDEIKANGVDEVYCVSVNDAFVMNAWARDQGIEKVKMIPDGNAEFTEGVGFSTTFKNRGFRQRSWRYSAVIIDGIIEKEFVESGLVEDSDPDPFEVSDAETMLAYLKENK